MNNIENYIIEKLKINSKTKIAKHSFKLSKKQEEQIIKELCEICQYATYYKDIKYNTGLEVLEKFFNNYICDFLDYYQAYAALLESDELTGVNINDLAMYIEDNNNELYKEIKDFVL